MQAELKPDHTKRRERISLMRSRLMAKCPFMGHICLKLEIRWTTAISTMGVTRDRTLYVNPDFLDSLTDEEIEATICHETLHPALLCFERQGHRVALVNGGISLWNISHDYAINMIIADFGLKLPKGALLDYKKWRNMSAEEIYDVIYDEAEEVDGGEGGGEGEGGEGEGRGGSGNGIPEPNQPPKGKGKGKGRHIDLPDDAWGHEDMLPDRDMTEAEKNYHDTQWKITVVEAAQVHAERKKGVLPGDLQKVIDEMLDPKVPWEEVLARWVGENGRKADYTYARPHRRSESAGAYLPSMKKQGCDKLVVLWDTSGSMDGREKWIAPEVLDIAENMAMGVRVICCDVGVCSDVEEVQGPEDFLIRGGGGSNFNPAFDLLTDEGFEGVVIVFTDGWIAVPEVKPTFLRDCLWVIGPSDVDPTGGAWGQVLQIDEEGYAV